MAFAGSGTPLYRFAGLFLDYDSDNLPRGGGHVTTLRWAQGFKATYSRHLIDVQHLSTEDFLSQSKRHDFMHPCHRTAVAVSFHRSGSHFHNIHPLAVGLLHPLRWLIPSKPKPFSRKAKQHRRFGSFFFRWTNQIVTFVVVSANQVHTHGSYIEEKGTAMLWHYGDAEPEFGAMQARSFFVFC